MKNKIIILFFLPVCIAVKGFSQDSIRVKPKFNFNSFAPPKKAATMSAILPGFGQAYNKKYWKIPVVYALFGGVGYAFYSNNQQFQFYKKNYIARVDGDPTTVDEFVNYSDDNIKSQMEYFHRYRDLSAVGIFVVYVLNIVDASVDAHLAKFDVSDNLSLHFQPLYQPVYKTGLNTSGIKLTATFK